MCKLYNAMFYIIMYIIVHCSALDVYICCALFLSLSCHVLNLISRSVLPSIHRDEEEIYYSSAEESDSEEDLHVGNKT